MPPGSAADSYEVYAVRWGHDLVDQDGDHAYESHTDEVFATEALAKEWAKVVERRLLASWRRIAGENPGRDRTWEVYVVPVTVWRSLPKTHREGIA